MSADQRPSICLTCLSGIRWTVWPSRRWPRRDGWAWQVDSHYRWGWERTREAAEQEAARVAESLRVEHLAEHARDKRTVHGHLPIHPEGQP